jgi:tetratricopeptide (TPR) repeat protein
MSNYVNGTHLSYRDYLQAKSFETSIIGEISQQTRSIIASNEEMRAEHITVLKGVSAGIEQLSVDVQNLRQGVAELNATFEWGFNEVLTALGRVNDTLAELLKTVKTPEKTWAYEQFEDARDAFRKKLYPEALEFLDLAINGSPGHPGYKLEYRFHYLLGTIRMGSFQNTSNEILNLAEAEVAFLRAAKYARDDNPHEAGRALLAAGWTAYCQGKMAEASSYTFLALGLLPKCAEGQFQLAKIQTHVGDCENALLSLKRAIELDRGYTIKAAGDGDFRRYDAKVYALIDTLRQDARQKAEALLATAQSQAAACEAHRVHDFTLVKYAKLDSVKDALGDASSAMRLNTYFGYLDAISSCEQAIKTLRQANLQFVREANHEATQQIANLDRCIHDIRNGSKVDSWLGVGILGPILSFIIGCVTCSMSKPIDPGTGFEFIFDGSALTIFIAVVGYYLHKFFALSNLKDQRNRLENIRSEIRPAAEVNPMRG